MGGSGVSSEKGEDVILTATTGLDDQGEIRGEGSVVGETGSSGVGVGAGDIAHWVNSVLILIV